MSRTLLIDADIPIYMQSAKNETPINWGKGLWTLHSYEHDVIHGFDSFIRDICEKMETKSVIMAVSDDVNFRYSVLDTYKHNRSDKRPPMLRQFLKEYVEENYETFKRPGLEGDDILGILSTRKAGPQGERIVVTIDKDLKTVPGKILNWNHAEAAVASGLCKTHLDALTVVTEENADYFHLLQTLAGDTTDGYGGCPGIGMQSADEILQDDPHIVEPEEWIVSRGKNKGEKRVKWVKTYGDFNPWETIVSYYSKQGLPESDALAQARVARICRSSDYDFKQKKVKLWTPEKHPMCR